MAALVTLLAIVVALLGILVAGLLRSHAEVLRALHDLGINLDPARHAGEGIDRTALGVPRPRADLARTGSSGFDISGVSPGGDAVTVAVTGADRLTLVAFLSSTCLTCRGFWEAFAASPLAVPGDARLVAVTKGPEAESPAAVRKLAPPDVVTVLSSQAWSAYGVPVAPYFVLVDGSTGDVVGEGAATTWEQVRHLMEQSMADAGWTGHAGRAGNARGAGHADGVERVESAARPIHESGKAREARVDDELRTAGIEPGHPSLYPGDPLPDEDTAT